MQFHIGDVLTGANLVILLGLWRKISIRDYQHGLLWRDFEKRKQLNGYAKDGE